jgi:TonB family protein
MTGSSNPRSGDLLAAMRPENVRPRDDRAVDPDARGSAFQLPAWSPTHWPKNVVPFTRARHGETTSRAAATLLLDPASRPAPLAATERHRRISAFLVLSLALHTVLYAAFWGEEPKPFASVGIESITVDLVIGANTEAGLATTPGENELQAAPADEVKPEDESVEQQERTPEARPETSVTERETKPDEVSEAKPEEPTPPEPPKEQPVENPKQQQPVQKKKAAPPRKHASSGAPSNTASGIGRGRSDNDTNYRGQVAAHLTRHKQYPAVARRNRDEGTATVSFTIDDSGRVTAANLVRGSGHASLDQEVQAMVRRASPFPPPPSGRTMSFTVPITYKLQ